MNSQQYETRTEAQRAGTTTLIPSNSGITLEQENARLRLALREARHRSYNQWQLLIGLAELEGVQPRQSNALDCSVRLCTMAYAFMTLNRVLDTDIDVLKSDRKVEVRVALESILTLLQATLEEDALHFTVQDAWLPEKGCAALMLIGTELVCNASKYGRKRTHLTFRTEGNQGILEVRDDGPGFPAGFRVQEQGRQGLRLVEALCRFDLHGEMRCHNADRGGVVTVTFPVGSASELSPTVEANKTFSAIDGIAGREAANDFNH